VVLGSKWVRMTCSDPDCGAKLKPTDEKCARCGGTVAGSVNKGENRLEAEERLGINQDDYDLDVGDPAESGVALPNARVERPGRDGRDARVES
jgi:hypothetical protein